MMLPEIAVDDVALGNKPRDMQMLQFVGVKWLVQEDEQAKDDINQHKKTNSQPRCIDCA